MWPAETGAAKQSFREPSIEKRSSVQRPEIGSCAPHPYHRGYARARARLQRPSPNPIQLYRSSPATPHRSSCIQMN
ncbi:unnamed protein product [Trichogramma brassicae]|uniref:Uncharacterized protein n=1 Tax=Trichogramma brassicae TaxID=86971 RepID=A0A6H5IVX9_9HYME|nr:unnamed protein product [Trichogramma brassicae]